MSKIIIKGEDDNQLSEEIIEILNLQEKANVLIKKSVKIKEMNLKQSALITVAPDCEVIVLMLILANHEVKVDFEGTPIRGLEGVISIYSDEEGHSHRVIGDHSPDAE